MLSCPTIAGEPFAQERIDWNKPSAPFHIIGNIYYVGTADLAIYLIVTPEGDILVDAGEPESPPLIEKNIDALGFHLSDIKFLINSHAHFDHAGGLAEIQKVTGAKVIGGAADEPILERGFITFGPSAPIHSTPVRVDRAVHDGDRLELGGIVLTAHLTPVIRPAAPLGPCRLRIMAYGTRRYSLAARRPAETLLSATPSIPGSSRTSVTASRC